MDGRLANIDLDLELVPVAFINAGRYPRVTGWTQGLQTDDDRRFPVIPEIQPLQPDGLDIFQLPDHPGTNLT